MFTMHGFATYTNGTTRVYQDGFADPDEEDVIAMYAKMYRAALEPAMLPGVQLIGLQITIVHT